MNEKGERENVEEREKSGGNERLSEGEKWRDERERDERERYERERWERDRGRGVRVRSGKRGVLGSKII